MKGFMPFLIFAAESYYSGNEPRIYQIQQVNTGKTLRGKKTGGQPPLNSALLGLLVFISERGTPH